MSIASQQFRSAVKVPDAHVHLYDYGSAMHYFASESGTPLTSSLGLLISPELVFLSVAGVNTPGRFEYDRRY